MKELEINSRRLPPVALRHKAEKVLKTRRGRASILAPDDSQKLLHELEVHQVESEMQNEELRAAKSGLEFSQAKYADLYDAAPVGYFTLDQGGHILEANLRGAQFLGVERLHLIKAPFLGFVAFESRPLFLAHFRRVFQKRADQSWDLKLLMAGGTSFYVRLESIRTDDNPEYGCCCRTAVIETTERKKAEEALRKAHDELELRVQQRTTELSETNRALEAQFLQRQGADNALKEAHDGLERRVQQRTDELSRANHALTAEIAQRLEAEHARHWVLCRLIEIQEVERGRIARELHDQFGQDLAGLNLSLKRIAEELPANSSLRSRVGQAMVTLGNLMRDAYGLVWNLRPPVLDDFGLSVALRRYASDWARHHGIPVDFHSRGLDKNRLPPPLEITLYRIAQEALTNVFKHARATRVSMLVERRPGHIALIVEDHGRGFQVDSMLKNDSGPNGHVGLLGMRERAALAGGTLDIESTPGSGTTLFARIPISTDQTKRGRSGL